jgi:hypothetical protein
VLEANGVGQIATDFGGHKIKPIDGAVGEPRRDQMEEPPHLLCTQLGCIRPEQGYGVLLNDIASRGAGSPLQIAFCLDLARHTSARKWSTSVIGILLFGRLVLKDLTPAAVAAPGAPITRESSDDLLSPPGRT